VNRVALVLLLTLALAAAACATGGAVTELKPGERPPTGSDEAGLWLQMDRAERQMQAAAGIVREPAINEYVRGIVCRIAGPHCDGVRVYIVRNPEFNASMAPNGMLQVWTGLLLRTANEAQLAYVLGHEVAHYLRRHSLQQMRDVQSKTAFVQVIGMVLGTAGGVAGGIGAIAAAPAQLGVQLATLGSVYAFSRDAEREADEVGFELMVRAGYDPREAPRAWQRLIAEREASGKSRPMIFFATHPPTGERVERLRTLASTAPAAAGEARVGREDYAQRIGPLRPILLRDEIHRREFAATDVLLRNLADDGGRLGEVHFFRGEMYRLRGDKDDVANAIEAYRKALEFDDAPVETHRGLGIVLVRSGERAAARAELTRYLERRPAAEDREMIKAQIAELER
jgi:predicted Zn-dependent protease